MATVMQSWFPTDETQPKPGEESLIRKQFKLTTSACVSLKREQLPGEGPPWGPAKASVQGLRGSKAFILVMWPTWHPSSI